MEENNYYPDEDRYIEEYKPVEDEPDNSELIDITDEPVLGGSLERNLEAWEKERKWNEHYNELSAKIKDFVSKNLSRSEGMSTYEALSNELEGLKEEMMDNFWYYKENATIDEKRELLQKCYEDLKGWYNLNR